MSRKRGLGRGLDALIPSESSTDPQPVVRRSEAEAEADSDDKALTGFVIVSVDAIHPNPHQPRFAIDDDGLVDLAASIHEHGLLQPLIVTRSSSDSETGARFQLIAGERRWRAARLAGLKQVAVIVKEIAPQEILQLALVENIQRADLNPLEEAQAFRQLIDEFGLTQDQVALRIGKSRVAVANTLRLLRAVEAVQQALYAGDIREGHARALLALDNREAQEAALDVVIKQGLNVRQTELLVRRWSGTESEQPMAPSPSADTQALENAFRESLGTKVSLQRSPKGRGRVTIHFYSDEELQHLYERIVGAARLEVVPIKTHTLVSEKLDQAAKILREKHIDVWLTFVRETSHVRDPVLDLILGFDLTWQSVLLVGKSGECVAIVGHFDIDNVRHIGAFDTIIGYHEGVSEPLREILAQLDPQSIAINYSEHDPAADGLTHGLFALLRRYLDGTPYATRLVTAENIIGALRGRKSKGELECIRNAVASTERVFSDLSAYLAPGQSERQLAHWIHQRVREMELDFAWQNEYCPTFTAGPDSPVGHAAPGNWTTKRGQTLQIDFGVKEQGFVADLQRSWYFLDVAETMPPNDVQNAFEAVRAALEAGRAALRPGAVGWEVDSAARSTIVDWGYPEFQHGLGHQVGRTAHDGSTLLGPRWERYGLTPYGTIEQDNVFTLELGVSVPQRGYIGLEEDVLVTTTGCEYVSTPQSKVWCI